MIFNTLYVYNSLLSFNFLGLNIQNIENKKEVVLLGDGFFARGFLHHINFNKFNITQIYQDEFINPQDIMYALQRGEDLNKKYFHFLDMFYSNHLKIKDKVQSFTYDNNLLKLNMLNNNVLYNCDYLVIGIGNSKPLKLWQNELQEIMNKKQKVNIVGLGPTGYELGSILSQFMKVDISDGMSKEKILTYVKPETKEKLLNLLNEKNININYEVKLNNTYTNPLFCFNNNPNLIEFNSSKNNFKVNKYLQSIANNQTYIGGDCVDSRDYIKNAQNAYQQGKYVAQRLNGDIEEKVEYEYKSNGIALNTGNKKVIIEGHKYIPDGSYPDFIIKLYSMFFV